MPKGRIRGNRARARQRSRYDLRDRYREGNVQIHNIGVLTIEDPYAEAGRIDSEGNLQLEARLEQHHHADGTVDEACAGFEAFEIA